MQFKLALLALIIQSYSAFAQIYPFYDGKLYGFKNEKRELVIQPKFTRISRLNDGYFAAEVKNYSWIILDSSAIQTHAEDSIYYPYKIRETNWIYFRRGKKEGIVDYKGNVILDAVYDDVSYMFGVFKIKKNGKYGLLDLKGNVLVEPIYERMPYSKDLEHITVRIGKKWGYINRFGEITIPIEYTNAVSFAGNVSFVAKEYGKWYMIDTSGKQMNTSHYRYIYHYWNSETFNVTTLDRKAQILNSKGRNIIQGEYHVLGSFEDGYASFKQRHSDSFMSSYKSYGYVDSMGNSYEFPYEDPRNINFNIHKAPNLAFTSFPMKLRIEEEPEILSFIGEPEPRPELPKYRDSLVEIEYLADRALHAFVEAPFKYEDYGSLSQICIVYGLLIDQNYSLDDVKYADLPAWKKLRKETLQKIVSSEKQRTLMWDWLRPLYEMAFSKLNPFAKKAYKGIAAYLKDYMNNYDLEATEDFLFKQEDQFARLNLKGEYDKHRKISAFVDRLILIHKVISVEDAKRWVNIIADEVESWE